MKSLMAIMLVLLTGLATTVRADAPPLANRIPGDAILYLGWAGTDALSTKYDASHLKKVVDASDLSQLFHEFIPQLIERVAREDQNVADVLNQVVQVGAPLWKHPTAFYFGGMDWTAARPVPHLALLCDAGADAPKLSEQIGRLLEQLPKDQGPLPMVKTYGSMVVVAFGTAASIDTDFAQAPVANLTKAPKFAAGLAQVQSDPAYIEYVDVDSAVKLIDDAMQRLSDSKMVGRWHQLRDSLGLAGLHDGIATGGFDGPDWMDEAFVSASDSRQGITSLFHDTPLSKKILETVPKSADRMAAGKFNLDQFVGGIRDIVAEIDQSTGDKIDGAMAMVNQTAGLDIRKDFLANLGEEWAVYSDRKIAGPGILGAVVVNHLKDAEAFDTALNKLVLQANAIIAQSIGEPNIKIEFHDQVVKGVTLHYLGIPFITPCWTVKDGNLYMGLYPQVVSAAVEQVAGKSPSILDRPEYIALMKRLGNHPASSVSFSNLPATAPEMYSGLLLFTRMYLGYADIFGVHPPAIVVPPLENIMAELSPSGSVVWSDAMGLHAKSVCPFPGCEMISRNNDKPIPNLLAACGLAVQSASK
jgi:hypothetical protein